MQQFLHRIWSWLHALFTGQKSLREVASEIKDVINGTTEKNNKYDGQRKPRGKLVWDGRWGTHRRTAFKIGRNVVCPCGAMRAAPGDISKRKKYKDCCMESA